MTTQALLNFNGVNATQVFTDDTGNQTWSVKSGNPVLSDVEKRFGTTSLRLDEVDNSSIETTLVNPLTDDFTIECWFNLDGSPFAARTLFDFHDIGVRLGVNSSLNFIVFQDDIVGPILNEHLISATAGNWYHIALVRLDGRVFYVFNGLVISSPVEWLGTISDVVIGVEATFTTEWAYDEGLQGYIDSVRISDVALYQTNSSIYDIEPGLIASPKLMGGFSTEIDHLFPSRIFRKSFKGNDLDNYMSILCGAATIIDPGPGAATSVNTVSGNVSKLGLPYELKVVVVSLEFNPSVVGHGVSDPVTGDYSIDIYPWTEEVMVYAVQDYGLQFNPSSAVVDGQVIHPTTPNKNVFVAQNSGNVGSSEPIWPASGNIVSGQVTFTSEPLYRPLINGFLKPTVVAI